MEYRCVAESADEFIRRLAVSYITHGYWFYVTGLVPERKDPAAVDAKLIARYGIAISKWARCRRKKLGLANMQYLRHGRFFVLLATHGRHAFFEHERRVMRDVRRVPIKFGGYAIGYRNGHVSVRINCERYQELKAYLVDLAPRRSAEDMEMELRTLDFEPYAPVRRQLLSLLCAVNAARTPASVAPLPADCLRLRRCVVQSPQFVRINASQPV